ncbi:MAG: hypothetical protein SGJ09_11195 [Phycisphaerae bacterium]|nr:hypothetical protein [Phycisphaerae bacterium]
MLRALVLAVYLLSSPAIAADFVVEGEILKIDGEIKASDAGTFATLLAAGTIKTVSINSPGGDLKAGLKMGQLIRAQKLTTYVEGGVREAASAAAYVFMGGSDRIVKGPRGVGVHAFFTPAKELRMMLKQKSGDELVATLNEFERRTQEATMAVVEYVTMMIGDNRIVGEAVKSGSDAMIWPDAKTLLDMKVATKLVELRPDELPDPDWAYVETVAAIAAWVDPRYVGPGQTEPMDERARAILEAFLADENRATKLRQDVESLLARSAPPSRIAALDRVIRPLADSIARQARDAAAAQPPGN